MTTFGKMSNLRLFTLFLYLFKEIIKLIDLFYLFLSSTKLRCARDIKDRLLRLLLTQSHHLLAAAGCPLDEVSNRRVLVEQPGHNRINFSG